MNELKKSIHDSVNGLDYTLVNDHYLPNLTAAAPAEQHPTGRWGRLHKKYLEERATKYQSVAYEIGAKIQEMTGQEIRVTVPGHMQRGGTPVPYDRVLSTRIGAHAADMIKNNEFGKLVVVKNNVITDIPLAESAGKLKYVDPQSDIVKEAKLIGISFGD